MEYTNFTAVRADSGFEEWNGTTWVPVGGGASATIVPYGATTNVELTEVGQQFTLAGEYDVSSPPGNAVVTFSCPLAPTNPVIVTAVYTSGAPPVTNSFVTKNDGSITMQNYPFLLQGTLAAIGDYGAGPQAYVVITGFAIGVPIA
jgi:hypothetical protein